MDPHLHYKRSSPRLSAELPSSHTPHADWTAGFRVLTPRRVRDIRSPLSWRPASAENGRGQHCQKIPPIRGYYPQGCGPGHVPYPPGGNVAYQAFQRMLSALSSLFKPN